MKYTLLIIVASIISLTGCGSETREVTQPAPVRDSDTRSDTAPAGTLLASTAILDVCEEHTSSIPGWNEAVAARRGALISGSGDERNGTCQAFLNGTLVLTVDCIDGVCEVQ